MRCSFQFVWATFKRSLTFILNRHARQYGKENDLSLMEKWGIENLKASSQVTSEAKQRAQVMWAPRQCPTTAQRLSCPPDHSRSLAPQELQSEVKDMAENEHELQALSTDSSWTSYQTVHTTTKAENIPLRSAELPRARLQQTELPKRNETLQPKENRADNNNRWEEEGKRTGTQQDDVNHKEKAF